MTTERDLPQEVDAPSRSHGQAQLYAEAIVRTIRQPLIILSGGFVVEANPAFYRTFLVGPEETEGRPIQELGNGQWNIPALRDMLENVLPNNGNVEDFRVEHDFEQLGRRVMLLNAHRMEGADRPGRVLLAIEDITERERSRFELEAQKVARSSMPSSKSTRSATIPGRTRPRSLKLNRCAATEVMRRTPSSSGNHPSARSRPATRGNVP